MYIYIYIYIYSRCFAREAFDTAEVAGRVLVLSAALDEEEANALKDGEGDGEGDGDDLGPSDPKLFGGPLLARVRASERAQARAVVFVAEDEAPLGAVRLAEGPCEPDEAWPSIPAVIVGRELGSDVLEALRQEVKGPW